MSASSTTVQALLRLAGSAAAMAEIAPDLSVTARIAGTRVAHLGADAPRGGNGAAGALAREGVSVLEGVVPAEVCAALVRGVAAFHERDLPATFIYAFDEIWAVGEELRQRISALLGHDYRLAKDIWAWHVAPGSGRGWPAHRGVSDVQLDRGAPEIINAWIALTDVAADRACMHVVPLDDDPGYPDALDRLDAPLEAVRALPVATGSALFWNANVLHWGGRCALGAAGPRISGSFTLCRADAAGGFPDLALLSDLDGLGFAERMDTIARMILLYGAPTRGDVAGVVRDWASLQAGLAARFGHRKAP